MKTWLKDNASVIGAVAGIIVALAALLQLVVVGPMNRGFADLRSEMNGRFDDIRAEMNQRFDDVRAEMDQRFDQQDKHMNARFDQQDKYMDARFEAMDQRFDQQDKYMNARFEAMDQRFDRLSDEVSELRILVTGIAERVSRNEGRIQIIREQLQTVDAPAP